MINSYDHKRGKGSRIVLACLSGVLLVACLAIAGISMQGTRRTFTAFLPATATPSPTSSFTPTCTHTPTSVPTPTPTSTPEPEEPEDHYWLARPFDAEANNEPSRFYPFGSTAGDRYRVHHGADFPNSFGTPVFSPVDGRVIVAGADDRRVYGARLGFYGQLVIIQLKQEYRGQKLYVVLGHLSQVHVHFLQEVDQGDLVGEVGMTGVAIGPHLHLEVRVGANSYDSTRNPELWLRPLPGKGTIVGRLLDSQGRLLSDHRIVVYRAETPDRRWQDLTTYPSSEVSPDEEWEENFVLGDVPAGEYLLKTSVDDHLYTAEVSVTEGETSFAVIEAQ